MLRQLEFLLAVSEQNSSLKSGIKNNLNQIGGKYALSWPVAFVSYFWATFISAGFDATRFNTPRTGWWLAATIAHAALILIAIPFRSKVLPVTERKSKPLQALLIFALLGLTRSLIIGQLAVWFNLAPTAELGYRQITGLVSVTTGLSVTTILVTSIAQRAIALRELTQEREQLTAIKNQSEQLFEEKRKEVLDIIDESIKPSLNEINEALSTNKTVGAEVTEQTTKLISALIDERLRPISDSLHEPTAFLSGSHDWTKVRSPIVRRNTKISVRSLISPLLITFMMSAVTISGSVYYIGLTGVLIGSLIYLPFLVIALLARQLIPDEWKLNIWLALPLTSLAHTGAGFPTFYLIRELGQRYEGVNDQLLIAVIGFTLTSTGIAFLRAMESERKAFESDFKSANEEASAILANVNQRIWVNRKNTAQLLHGSVQASLTAANLRLRQGNLTEAELLKVRADINRAISSITSESNLDIDLEQELEDLIDLWDGVCDIDIAIKPEIFELLAADPTATYCINEFVRECVNNAIKHGRSSEIKVTVEHLEPATLTVFVENNGEVNTANQAGLGTRILDEITIDWNRMTSNGRTTVMGQIALLPVK